MLARTVSVAIVLCFTAALAAQDNATAFIGAKIIPIEGDEIERGTLLVADGKIVAVGQVGEVDVPDDAQRVFVGDKVIMPGLICTHSHIGGVGGADSSHPIQPDIRIYDSINILDSGFKRALAGGLTTLNIMPGSGHLMSGQTIYVKVRAGADSADRVEDWFIRDAKGQPMGGMKMANGTNPMRPSPFASTRGKAAAMVRQHFIRAQEYRDKVRKAEEADDKKKMPDRDIGMDAMMEVLNGSRIVHHHTHRHDDIMTVLRLAKEFDFRVVLHHVSEAWKVAEEIAEVPCSIILIDSPGGKLEARYLVLETAAVLERAGALVAFHTDDFITDSRLFFRMAALGVRAGMSRAGALRALTINGAKMLDLDQRIGSLEPGKDADFIILDGEPLSVYTKVLETWVEGERMFDRADPQDRLYAVGGYGAGHDQSPYFCCYQHLITGGQ